MMSVATTDSLCSRTWGSKPSAPANLPWCYILLALSEIMAQARRARFTHLIPCDEPSEAKVYSTKWNDHGSCHWVAEDECDDKHVTGKSRSIAEVTWWHFSFGLAEELLLEVEDDQGEQAWDFEPIANEESGKTNQMDASEFLQNVSLVKKG